MPPRFAEVAPPGPIVLTRDGRTTGPMIADIVAATLCAAGRHVLDGEVAATPTTGVLIQQHQAAGGIQISASHNPAPYNGMKLFGNDGRVLSAQRGEIVLQKYHAGPAPWVQHAALGFREQLADTIEYHMARVMELVDVEAIRQCRFRVVLDSNHGAGSSLGVPLLEHLGCDVVSLGKASDGQFDHLPEPTSANVGGVGQRVVAERAVIGFCQDPDADRLALLDADGSYVGEEYTVALCAHHRLHQAAADSVHLGPLVTNCATSRMSRDIADKFGVSYVASAVGEANVADAMIDVDAIFGGEGNGGPIEPRVGYVPRQFCRHGAHSRRYGNPRYDAPSIGRRTTCLCDSQNQGTSGS